MAVIAKETDRIYLVSLAGTLMLYPKVLEIRSGEKTHMRLEAESFLVCDQDTYQVELDAIFMNGQDISLDHLNAIQSAATKPKNRENLIQIMNQEIHYFWIAKKHSVHDGWQLFPTFELTVNIDQLAQVGRPQFGRINYSKTIDHNLSFILENGFVPLLPDSKQRIDYLEID